MNEMPDSLLAADEPAPVTVHNEHGRSPFLIVAARLQPHAGLGDVDSGNRRFHPDTGKCRLE
jgi:hypothetical protein